MSRPLTRRDAVQLGAVVLGGWAITRVLPRDALRERDLKHVSAVSEILGGRESPAVGPLNASVRLAVFTDYFCPACRRGFYAMEKAVRSDGDVRIIYKDWPIFGPPSERAARVALASAEQGLYPAVHRGLMSSAVINDDRGLRDVVLAAGGDWRRATAQMLTHEQSITARLKANRREALQIGLAGTPGYLAESKLVIGAIEEADFIELFGHARGLA
jgi:protein-disulfide isomerase